ncbi:MAG: hypothetical protein JJE07_02265 [Flavobacteriaceae bacterium]|nr:hypothetical protein [Flavobacteriaceae bacterium]
MKIKNSFLFVVLLLIFIGCSKEDDNNNPAVIDKSANLKALGFSSNELVSDEKFTSLKIEVVYVTGFQPTQTTLDNLKTFLEIRTHKPDGILITTRAVASSNKAPFNINEIAQIEADERTAYNAGDEIAVFIYFADGSNENDTDTKTVLGTSFRNTSIVIYGKTIQSIANHTNNLERSTVESTVVSHEFGHLFGLVNMGTPMQTNHEDAESNGHCSVTNCLMAASFQFGGSMMNVFDNNTIPFLDDLCIGDLQANGGR